MCTVYRHTLGQTWARPNHLTPSVRVKDAENLILTLYSLNIMLVYFKKLLSACLLNPKLRDCSVQYSRPEHTAERVCECKYAVEISQQQGSQQSAGRVQDQDQYPQTGATLITSNNHQWSSHGVTVTKGTYESVRGRGSSPTRPRNRNCGADGWGGGGRRDNSGHLHHF